MQLPALCGDISHCGSYYTIFFPSAFAATIPGYLTNEAQRKHTHKCYCHEKVNVRTTALNCEMLRAGRNARWLSSICPPKRSPTKVCPAAAPGRSRAGSLPTGTDNRNLPALLVRVMAGSSTPTGKHQRCLSNATPETRASCAGSRSRGNRLALTPPVRHQPFPQPSSCQGSHW